LSQRVRILTTLKKWKEAIQDLTTLEDLRGRAWILSLAGRTEEALADLDRLQEKDPRDGSLYLLRAEIQLRAQQWSNTLTTIKRLEEFNPHLPKATLIKAEVYLGKGEPDQTIILTTEAFEADPLFGEALILRGKAWLAKKRPDLAEKDFQAAISIDSRMEQQVPQSQTP
jgi:tetratricopeptide (TPR) repeat protein